MNNELQSQLNFESPAPFFSTPALSGLKQQIGHLAQFGGSLIVVEGEQGSGKSVLANKLHSEFSVSSSVSTVLPVLLRIADDENIDSFFLRFCTALGLPVSDSAAGECIVVVRSYLQSLVREQKLRLVIIDDADLLSDETLAALLSVLDPENTSHGIHLVLVARPGLAKDIDRLSSVSLAAYDFSMPNFSPSELERFIDFVLPDEYQTLFGEKGVWTAQGLWSKSRGIPGAALALVSDSKSMFAESEHHREEDNDSRDAAESKLLADKAPIPFLHAGLLFVLVAALIWVFVNNRSDREESLEATQHQSGLTVNKIPLSTAGVPRSGERKMTPTEPSKAAPIVEQSPLPEELAQVEITSSGAATKTHSKAERIGGQSLRSPESLERELERPASSEYSQAQLQPKASDSNHNLKPVKLGSPKSTPNVSTENTQKTEEALTAKQKLSKDEAFLLSLPTSHYVLQILAASKPDSLQSFIQAQPNRRDLRLYQGSREGKSWYVVVIASFESRVDAISAIKSLPIAQSKSGPWAKPISTVVAEIKENRRI